jgi:hypothetical protein
MACTNTHGFVTRYCASELSIPQDAVNVATVYDNVMNRDLNPYTLMPYGFKYDVLPNKSNKINIFELDMFSNSKVEFPDRSYLYSYDSFVNHYHDENFLDASYYEENNREYDDDYNIVYYDTNTTNIDIDSIKNQFESDYNDGEDYSEDEYNDHKTTFDDHNEDEEEMY